MEAILEEIRHILLVLLPIAAFFFGRWTMRPKRDKRWHDIGEMYPPEDTWVLVRNSAGVYAAVNEITENTASGEFRGWTVSPEQENLLIGGITHWAVIEPPNDQAQRRQPETPSQAQKGEPNVQ